MTDKKPFIPPIIAEKPPPQVVKPTVRPREVVEPAQKELLRFNLTEVLDAQVLISSGAGNAELDFFEVHPRGGRVFLAVKSAMDCIRGSSSLPEAKKNFFGGFRGGKLSPNEIDAADQIFDAVYEATTQTREPVLQEKSAAAQGEKLLWGVRHAPEELSGVIEETLQRHPSKVGLELPEDYLLRQEKYGSKFDFFGDIAASLGKAGVSVVPLESPELWDRHRAIEIARSVREGKLTEDDLNESIRQLKREVNDEWATPEKVESSGFLLKRRQMAADILAEAPTLEKVKELWSQNNAERESYVAEKISASQPDIAIIGRAHVEQLKDKLSGYTHSTPEATEMLLKSGGAQSAGAETKPQMRNLDREQPGWVFWRQTPSYNEACGSLKEVPVDQIVGSMSERADEYFADGTPVEKDSRWEAIYERVRNGEDVSELSRDEPIHLYRLPSGEYFIGNGGNHRVSVAKVLGKRTVKAAVQDVIPP